MTQKKTKLENEKKPEKTFIPLNTFIKNRR